MTEETLSPAAILANRRAWIEYLRRPDTKQGRGRLVNSNDLEARCCLGHACHVLGLELQAQALGFSYAGEYHYAPPVVVEKLGMWNKYGQNNLAYWNDAPSTTQREIADYLETVLEGGPDTPFRPL